MDEHGRLGERRPEAVVVGDDQIDPELAGHRRLGGAGDPAVDGDHELRPLRRQAAERLGVEAVPLLEAVGHIPLRRRPEGLKTAQEDRRGAHAVGVVIAVDHDPRPVAGGGENPLGRGRHPGEQFGIAEILKRAGEERPRRGSVDKPASGEQPGDDRRHAGGPLEPRHHRRILRLHPPALRHVGGSFPRAPPRRAATPSIRHAAGADSADRPAPLPVVGAPAGP